MNGIQGFLDLLDQFRQQFLPRPGRLPTWMEIAGYPHYENVCSNVLAFFLDPNRPHELGTLFLQALARAGGIDDKEGMMDAEVHREVITDARKRIDILILSDSHAVLIENKIFAGATNPFADYANYLRSLSRRYEYKFLLTLVPNNAGKDYGFCNIHYEKFIGEIRRLLDAPGAADNHYLTFLIDFLDSLDHLRRERDVDRQFLQFLEGHLDTAEDFLEACEGMKKDLRRKVDGLHEMLGQAGVSQTCIGPHVSRTCYFRGHLKCVLSYTIKSNLIQNDKIKVRAVIDPKGWIIEIALEKGHTRLNQGEWQDLHHKAERVLKIKLRQEDDHFVGGYPDSEDFSYETELDQHKGILPAVRDVVRDFAAAGG